MSVSTFLQELFVEHRSNLLMCITIVGGLLCLVPMSYDSHLEDTTLAQSIRTGPMFRYLVVGVLALALPVYMNLIVDFYVDAMGTKTSKSEIANTKDILTKQEKLVFMVGIVIFPIVSCFTGGNKAILLATCCTCVQQQFVAGIVATSLNRFNRHFFPTSIFSITLSLFTVGSISRVYAVNTCATLTVLQCTKSSISLLQTYVTWIPAFVILILLLFWLSSLVVDYIYGVKVRNKYYRWPTSWPTSWGVHRNHEQQAITSENTTTTPAGVGNAKSLGQFDDGLLFFRVIYCLTIIAWVIIQAVVRIGKISPQGASPYSTYDDYTLVLQCIPFIFFQVSVLFFEMRLVKHEAVSNLLALIDAKKTYVRYISHELRTPLSAANSGLQMLHAGKITS